METSSLPVDSHLILVYSLDAYPDICRNLTLKQGVESFIAKGANLMWPGVEGVDQLPSDLSADTVLAIRKADGQPYAVGALACDVETVQSGKQEGIACYVLHHEGDNLWNAGSREHGKIKWDRKQEEQKEQEILEKLQKKKERRGDDEEEETDFSQLLSKTGAGGIPTDMSKGKAKHVPKELKTGKDTASSKPKGKDTKEKGGKADEKEDKKQKGKKDKDAKDGDKDKGKKGAKKGKKGQESESESEEEAKPAKAQPEKSESEEDSEDWKNEKKGKGAKKDKKEHKEGAKAEEKDEGAGISKEQMKEMDERIMEAFLNATKLSITDKDLPIECGKLWTNFIIKCKGSDSEDLDFKLSSHKKIGKFLQNLQKDKILTYEEASKKNPVPKVTKIDFSHKKIEDWTPTVTAKEVEQRNAKDDDEGDQAKNSWRVQIEIAKLYKPNDAIKKFVDE